MASLRKSRGWTQERLAEDIGIPRATLAKWESGGLPRSEAALSLLAKALGVETAELYQQWPERKDVARLEKHPLYVDPFPSKSSVEEMCELGPRAQRHAGIVHANPALEYEMRNGYPQESPYELLAAYDLLVAGMKLEFWSLDELGCRLLVTELKSNRRTGHQLRHALRWELPEGNLLLLPQ